MKLFLSLVLGLFLTAPVYAFAEQNPTNTVCNEDSGLAWDLGSETDLKSYKVYGSNAPIIEAKPESVLLEIDYDPTKVVTAEDGKKTVTESFGIVLSEGDKYFRLSAVDTVGNESDLSNMVGCNYNVKPSAPTGVTIQLKFAK